MGDTTTATRGNLPGASWTIRAAEAGDLDALARFSVAMAAESEGRTVAVEKVHAALAKVIRDPALGQMFIAEEGGEAIGSCMLNGREWSEWRDGLWYWITGMYVVPAHRRSGVRFDLHRHAVEWARAQPGVLGFRAYVHRSNDLEIMLGTHTAAVHNRAQYDLKPMSETNYVVIEVEF